MYYNAQSIRGPLMDLIDFRRVPESFDGRISFKWSLCPFVPLHPRSLLYFCLGFFFLLFSVRLGSSACSVASSERGGNLTCLIRATDTAYVRV